MRAHRQSAGSTSFPAPAALEGEPELPFAAGGTDTATHRPRKTSALTFEDFVDAELSSLLRYAQVLSGDRHLAKDIVGDTLLKVFRSWDRIRSTRSPAAYVHRMVTNRFLSLNRSWSLRNVFLTTSGELPQDREVPPASQTTEDRVYLEQMLRRLPLVLRTVLVLRFYVEMNDAEIAVEMHCSPATVAKRIARALKALRIESDSGGSDVPNRGLGNNSDGLTGSRR